jgi:hypothetical protein
MLNFNFGGNEFSCWRSYINWAHDKFVIRWIVCFGQFNGYLNRYKKVEQAIHCEMTMPFMPLENEVQQFQIIFSKTSTFED